MRTYLIVVVVIAVFASVTPAVQAQPAADEAAIRKILEQRIAIWENRDAKGLLALLDDDCVRGRDGTPCSAAVRESGEIPETWPRRVRLLEDQGIVFITPDVAMYRWIQESSDRFDGNGEPLPPVKQQLVRIFVKKDGKWLQAVGGIDWTIEE